MRILPVMRLCWLMGGLAIGLAPIRDRALGIFTSEPLLGADAEWFSGDFQNGRAYPSTSRSLLPSDVRTTGSWVDSDVWQGSAVTRWAKVTRGPVRVGVAGYPQKEGCRIWAEFHHEDGGTTRLLCPIADPKETWTHWDFQPPPTAINLRILAEDRSIRHGGWIAFSEPYRAPGTLWPAAYMGLQIATTLALALTLVWVPGILLASTRRGHAVRAAVLVGTGPLALAAIGIAIWLLNAWPAKTVATAFVSLWWLGLGCGLLRRPSADDGRADANAEPDHKATIVIASALVAIAAVAKASYSGGPEGELFAGTTSRTLAVGDRSDAGIPFTAAQVAANRLAPHSAEAERLFTPWTFFSRGPIAGLAALPVVLVTAGMLPADFQLTAWEPFDATGYAACRIVLVVLASTVFVALYSALARFTDASWAAIGAGLLALCPFGVHEVMFTWPKWAATSALVLAFLLAHDRRPALGGVALGFGFLLHPLAGLWAPFLALWAGARSAAPAREFVRSSTAFTLGACLLVLPWMLLGKIPPQLPGTIYAGQGGFLEYFRLAELQRTDWPTWWQTRWMNFANTFLPFWLHLFHRDHPVLNAHGAQSGDLVKFAFGWWNTLPLGMGLPFWGTAMACLWQAARRRTAVVSLLVLGPALLLIAYWGAAATGLMRECGHPLLVAIVGLTIVTLAESDSPLRRWVAHPITPWLQLPEVFLMLWLTTLVRTPRAGDTTANLDWVYAGVNVLAVAGLAFLLSRVRSAGRALASG